MIQVGTSGLQYFFGTNPDFLNNRAFVLALFVSVVTHVAVFVSTKDIDLRKYQWQAPELAVEVSLNFLHPASQPVKPDTTVIPANESAQKKNQPAARTLPESRAAKPSPTTNRSAAASEVADKARRGETDDSDRIRDNYLSDLLTHIEGYKYYPLAARRRNLGGAVKVSFLLLGSGDIDGLEVSGGTMLLRRAAGQAVRRALPLPPPPREIRNPERVSFVMHYRLRQSLQTSIN